MKISNQQVKIAAQLFIAASICLLTIYGLFLLTKNTAKLSEKKYLIQSLAKVLPINSFNNDLLTAQTHKNNQTIYQACLNGSPNYQIYAIQTTKGYNGLIKLLVSIDIHKNKIIQVRSLFHQETPGLGDQIIIEKSDWIRQLNLPLSRPTKFVAVKQDGGEVDAITGATITSRAVTDLIRKTFFSPTFKPVAANCGKKAEEQ